MNAWPGLRRRNASSSNAFGLIGTASPSRRRRWPARSTWTRPRSTSGCDVGGGGLLRAPEERPDPGRQLAQAERLRDVVVGAELEPDDLVELAVLGGQHHDRHAGLGADDPADLDAGQLGEHQVQQDEVRALGAERARASRPSAAGTTRKPSSLERVRERLAQRRLVLHDEDRSCHRRIVRAVLTSVHHGGDSPGVLTIRSSAGRAIRPIRRQPASRASRSRRRGGPASGRGRGRRACRTGAASRSARGRRPGSP